MARVQVEQGWLESELLDLVTEDGTYYSFKGIPYAQPPIGKLRFKAPQPPLPWEGVRKATQHGPVCPNYNHFFNELHEGSEDCLYLNVYTPKIKPKLLLPVMFFIHGGGYRCGSGNVDEYGPDFLVQQEVVLVTINYRLEVLGFLCLDTVEVPGNAGLKDQNAALKWVNRNISNFGGDPSNITVFGQSAGGASVGLHAISPMSRGLFQRAILLSGVPLCDWSRPSEPKRRALMLAKQLEIQITESNELLEELQNVPVHKLVKTSPNIFGSDVVCSDSSKFTYFGPVYEKNYGQETFFTEDPIEYLRKGNINDVDVMIGFTNQEGLYKIPHFPSLLSRYNQFVEMFVPREISMKYKSDEVLKIGDRIQRHYFGNKSISEENAIMFLNLFNDTHFKYNISRFARKLPTKNDKKKYFYQFSCESERNFFGRYGEKYGICGASHIDDLYYLFDPKMHKLSINKNYASFKMIQQTCRLFANFAKFGNPTPDKSLGVCWPEYNNVDQYYMDISEKLTIGTKLCTEMDRFLDSFYEEDN